MRLFLVALLLTACGRSVPQEDADLIDQPDGDEDLIPDEDEDVITVVPLVAGLSDRWNAYVRTTGEDPRAWTEECTLADTYRDCRHAGELQRVDLPAGIRCSGLTMIDSLDALDWQCVELNDEAGFASRGFKTGRGLRNLLDFTVSPPRFKPMSVTITSATRSWSSVKTTWWTNTVASLPIAGAARLTAENTVYVTRADGTPDGILVDGNGIAVVTRPGSLLTKVMPTNACRVVNGATIAAPCLIHVGAVSRFWVETDIAGYDLGSDRGAIHVDGGGLGEIHGQVIGRNYTTSLFLESARAVRVVDTSVSRGGPVIVQASTGNLMRNVRLAGAPLWVQGSAQNVFDELTVFATNTGILVNQASRASVFTRLVSFGHADNSLTLQSDGDDVLAGYTLASSTRSALGVNATPRATFHLGALLNTQEEALFTSADASTFSGITISSAIGSDVVTSANPQRFTGMFVITDTPSCNPDVGASGLTASCGPDGLSDHTLIELTADPVVGFVGGLTTNDPVNSNDANGFASVPAAASSFDYVGAANRYRGWIGAAGGGFGLRNCPGGAPQCFADVGSTMQLFDWSLRGTDTVARGRVGPALLITGTCPGVLAETYTHVSGDTYLRAAIEMIDDEIGDDDGLCETGELCLYAANLGAYQGHGNARERQCAFANGTVLYGYGTNGY